MAKQRQGWWLCVIMRFESESDRLGKLHHPSYFTGPAQPAAVQYTQLHPFQSMSKCQSILRGALRGRIWISSSRALLQRVNSWARWSECLCAEITSSFRGLHRSQLYHFDISLRGRIMLGPYSYWSLYDDSGNEVCITPIVTRQPRLWSSRGQLAQFRS